MLRARGGMRLSGGTSTGSQYTDNCDIQVNTPTMTRVRNQDPACLIQRPFQTNVRANASYTIPWVDVLASVVFQYRPGVEMNGSYTFTNTQVTWDANPARALNSTGCNAFGGNTLGCFTQQTTSSQATTNLLAAGEKYGEGVRLMDLELAKNIRFAGKRLNVGVDIYNLFNSDAALGYDTTYNSIVAGQSVVNANFWPANSLVSPRFARFQVQFDF